MRNLVIALACLLGAASAGAGSEKAGQWSGVVDGLQGRLSVAEGTPFNGTGQPVVTLELRNVSDVGTPMEVPYSPGGSVKASLLDAAGKEQPEAGLPADIMMPLPFTLLLPYDSTLRFRVSVTGYGVPKGQRALIGMPNGAWLLKAGDRGTYFLQATFRAGEAKPGDFRAWKGTLELPKVEVP